MNYKELADLTQKKAHTVAMFFSRHGMSIKSIDDVRFYIDYVAKGKRMPGNRDASHLEPYQFQESDKQLKKARELVKNRNLIWYTNPMRISAAVIVEHTLSNGNFTDFLELIRIFGKSKVAKIFKFQIEQERINYKAPTINFFKHYFSIS